MIPRNLTHRLKNTVRLVNSPSFAGKLSVNAFGINDNLESGMVQADATNAVPHIVYPPHSVENAFVYPAPQYGLFERNPPCAPGTFISKEFHWCTAADPPEVKAAALGGVWCGGSCSPCKEGTYSEVSGMPECLPCPDNTAQSTPGGKVCAETCPLGYVHNAVSKGARCVCAG